MVEWSRVGLVVSVRVTFDVPFTFLIIGAYSSTRINGCLENNYLFNTIRVALIVAQRIYQVRQAPSLVCCGGAGC